MKIASISKFLGAPDSWAGEFVDSLKPFLIVIFAVMGAMAVGYAVWLAFLLAKAPDENKRKEAKSRIFKTIAGLFIIVILTSVTFIPDAENLTLIDRIIGRTEDMRFRTEWRVEMVNPIKKNSNSWTVAQVHETTETTGTAYFDIIHRDKLCDDGTVWDPNGETTWNGDYGDQTVYTGAIKITIIKDETKASGAKIMGPKPPGAPADSTGRMFYASGPGKVSIYVQYYDSEGHLEYAVHKFIFEVKLK